MDDIGYRCLWHGCRALRLECVSTTSPITAPSSALATAIEEFGEPRGYLEFATADGDKAYIKWTIQAVFVPGSDGKPKLLDNGVWQVVSGTGKLEKLQGAGTFHLIPTGPTERRFVLDGELVR